MAMVMKLWLWRFPEQKISEHSRRTWRNPAASDASVQEAFPETNLPCATCNGRGWTICSFCNGQKTNVQVRKSRFYRRCPSCKAVGATLCPQCKVYRCITVPNDEGGNLNTST